MPTQRPVTCQTCRYAELRTSDGAARACRRFPPQAGHGWPLIAPDFWCGEHKHRAGRPAKPAAEEPTA